MRSICVRCGLERFIKPTLEDLIDIYDEENNTGPALVLTKVFI